MVVTTTGDTGPVSEIQDEILLPDVRAWEMWLAANHISHAGIWLVLARKGTQEPTSLELRRGPR